MDTSVSRLASELKVKVHGNWLEELGKLPAFTQAPPHEKRNVFLTQFLHCDLNNAGAGCLPENLKVPPFPSLIKLLVLLKGVKQKGLSCVSACRTGTGEYWRGSTYCRWTRPLTWQ